MNIVGTVIKPTGAAWPVGFTFSGDDLPTGTTISSVTATVSPATGLTVGAAQVNADADGVYAVASGGTPGKSYYITFLWTRSDGMITPDVLCVKVTE